MFPAITVCVNIVPQYTDAYQILPILPSCTSLVPCPHNLTCNCGFQFLLKETHFVQSSVHPEEIDFFRKKLFLPEETKSKTERTYMSTFLARNPSKKQKTSQRNHFLVDLFGIILISNSRIQCELFGTGTDYFTVETTNLLCSTAYTLHSKATGNSNGCTQVLIESYFIVK